jgi:hypothetical protein
MSLILGIWICCDSRGVALVLSEVEAFCCSSSRLRAGCDTGCRNPGCVGKPQALIWLLLYACLTIAVTIVFLLRSIAEPA